MNTNWTPLKQICCNKKTHGLGGPSGRMCLLRMSRGSCFPVDRFQVVLYALYLDPYSQITDDVNRKYYNYEY